MLKSLIGLIVSIICLIGGSFLMHFGFDIPGKTMMSFFSITSILLLIHCFEKS